MNSASLLAVLSQRGMLLLQDPAFPNVVSLVTGEVLRGSWWGHKQGHEIFDLLSSLEEHSDVVFVKLVSGKVTLVHRTLFPALLAVCTAREPWQTAKLSPAALELLARVDGGEVVSAAGKTGKELETKLLVFARSVHTASGKHELEVSSWARWARAVKVRAAVLEAAKAELAARVAELNEEFGARGVLPWK